MVSSSVLKVKNISKEGDIWKEIFTIGVPACMNQLLLSIATYIFMGFAAGCQPLVGFNYGAKTIPASNPSSKRACS